MYVKYQAFSCLFAHLIGVMHSLGCVVIVLHHDKTLTQMCSKYQQTSIVISRAGQPEPTGRPHNSLGTRLEAARVYTYTEEGRERIN
jgi:hypothetical protein